MPRHAATARRAAALCAAALIVTLVPRAALANNGLAALGQALFALFVGALVQLVVVLSALISALVAKRSRAPFVVSIIAVILSVLAMVPGAWLLSAGGIFAAFGAYAVLMLVLSIVALLRARRVGR